MDDDIRVPTDVTTDRLFEGDLPDFDVFHAAAWASRDTIEREVPEGEA